MRKKYYSTMRFETKEDFDKHIDGIYNSGYESGYEYGMAEALSYVFEMLDHFDYDTQQIAERMSGNRQKKQAMDNMKAGITPIVAEDPKIRKMRKEQNRIMRFNKMINEARKKKELKETVKETKETEES